MAPSPSNPALGVQSMLNFTTAGARFPRREMQTFDPLVSQETPEPHLAYEDDDDEDDGTHTDLENAGFLDTSEAAAAGGGPFHADGPSSSASGRVVLSLTNSLQNSRKNGQSMAQRGATGGGVAHSEGRFSARRLQWPVMGLVALLVVVALLSRSSQSQEAGNAVEKASGLISLAKNGGDDSSSRSSSIADAQAMYEEAANEVANFEAIVGKKKSHNNNNNKGDKNDDDNSGGGYYHVAVVTDEEEEEAEGGEDEPIEEAEGDEQDEGKGKGKKQEDGEEEEEKKDEEEEDEDVKPFSLEDCSASGESCLDSKCCKEEGEFCFYKTEYWGRCLTECKPGVHLDEPYEWQQPWTCEMPVPRGQKPFPKLFCFMAMRSSGMEFKVGKKQAELRAGIFACDEYTVFSDDETELAPKIKTKLLKHFAAPLSVPGALTATWVNTQAFIEAWDTIIKSPEPWKCDWMVKVDPDTVFFPPRAKSLLRDLAPAVKDADTGAGVFIQNCDDPHLRFYGSMELLSHKALGAFKNRNETCDSLESSKMGEDMWMERCFGLLGVKPVQGYQLLHDQYCPAGTKEEKYCDLKAAGFHPYKAPEQWQQCHDWAMPGGKENA
eukprot:CAMPEP_0206465606 /NCGR_PEP_ID=MMETSP0324_2-20121206/27940_1 /ASSEMBLY_ACC=CAM_ASM_000836 /TAXON_ID=2866 /ORGANISM="Crypthecodinium cohnii, Strain Seligo" /LENGTH=606 /DNA_ID=CAMNT_0053938517 /DNA_START=181 /DNA_END=2001 /DNA_ORIENTATION=+